MNSNLPGTTIHRASTEKADSDIDLADVLEEYLADLERGAAPDRKELLARHPDIADQLAKCLDGLEVSWRFSAKFREDSSDGSSQDCVDGPKQFGDFRILGELGRGGMGVVYEAQQVSLPRRVALKVLPFAAVLDPRQLERFKNEARAAATLNHPGIVLIYSVGCERAVHFYAMQLIEGQSLAEVIAQLRGIQGEDHSTPELSQLTAKFIRGGNETSEYQAVKATVERAADVTLQTRPTGSSPSTPLDGLESTRSPTFFRSIARLGVEVAEALDHAHARGILHRDIKPGNLLLDTEGKVHVADFGLARIEQDAGMTMTGDILGTLRYMSPEQALAKRVVVDHRADIYSLGVTLYELMTLQPAFGATDRRELLKQIAFEEPQAPRRINKAIPSEVEVIVLNAIAKNPNDRYATALELADDLRCFLENKPISARRVGRVERFWRWSKRNPIVSGLTGAVAILAMLVAAVSAVGYVRTSIALAQVSTERDTANTARLEERTARLDAQQKRDEAIRNLYVAQMRMAQKDWEDGQITRLQETLLGYLPAPGELDLRGWEWYYNLSRCFSSARTLHGHGPGQVPSIAWSPDGSILASAQCHGVEGAGDIKIWNLETGAAIETIPHRGIEGCLFAWHPGVRRLVWRVDGTVNAIVVQHGQSRVTIKLEATINSVAWDPDGSRLATNGPNKTVIIWDAKTGARLRELIGHNTEVLHVSWSPDGENLAASGYEPGTITVWDAESGGQTATLESGEFNWCLTWSPGSRRLAVGTYSGLALVWEVTSGEKLLTLIDRGDVRSIAWSPDGSRLATGIKRGNITIWDASSGKRLRTIRSTEEINALAWNPDGKSIASAHKGLVYIWDVDAKQGVHTIAHDAVTPSGGIAFSPDDRRLAYWATGQSFKIRDADTGKEIHALPGPAGVGLRPIWSPDGQHLACGGDDGAIVVYDLRKNEVRNWQHEGVKAPISTDTHRSVAVAWHPNEHLLASVSGKEPTVRIWDVSTGKQLSSFDSSGLRGGVAWSPDGERLATVGKGGLDIRDRVGWRRLHLIKDTGHNNLVWSRDGKYLASGGFQGDIQITDTLTGRIIRTLTGHTSLVVFGGWSDDSRRLATFSKDGVRMWNPHTGAELFSLDDAKSMAWSHDRKRIATIYDGMVCIYDASIGYKMASDPSYRRQRVSAFLDEADRMVQDGKCQQAFQKLEAALSFAKTDAFVQSKTAWLILTLPDARFRDIPKAAVAARRGTELSPETSWNWMVLGIAQYRQGKFQAARTSLMKLVELDPDSEHPRTSCFLAMAYWQLGEKEAARQHYDDAVEWIDQHRTDDEVLLGFRGEAAELLGIDESNP